MHGPAPGNYSAPHYPQPIQVVDSLAYTWGPLKRAIWRKIRDRAIALWEQSGVDLYVVEDLNPDDWNGDLSSQYFPGTIHMLRGTKGETQWMDFASYNESSDSAIVVNTSTPRWWKDYVPWFKAASGVVCHELGHGLGLAHGGGGVMSGGWVPNAHDLQSVRDYYLP